MFEGHLYTAPSQSITIAEAANNWIKASWKRMPGERSRLLDQYQQHVRLHIGPTRGEEADGLTATHNKYYQDHLLGLTASPSLRRERLAHLA